MGKTLAAIMVMFAVVAALVYLAYSDIIYSGPAMMNMEIEGNKNL